MATTKRSVSKKKTVKAAGKKAAVVAPRPKSPINRPRKLKKPQYKSFRLSKRIKHSVKLPSAWKITKKAIRLLFTNKKIVSKIILIYGLLNIVLVRGLSGGADVAALKSEIASLGLDQLSGVAVIFEQLLTSSNTPISEVASAYQSFIVILTSLALVWTFRQLMAGKPVRARDGFYRGTYPLIPVILVLLVVSLQFLPMVVGAWLYNIVVQTGIAVLPIEKMIWLVIFFLLALLSIYMVCSSIFALYIVALPNMTPMRALRSARGLVRHRRWAVMRKVLFLPFMLVFVGLVLIVPFILFAPVLAQWVFFVLTMAGLAASHAYMYTLYRELLNE